VKKNAGRELTAPGSRDGSYVNFSRCLCVRSTIRCPHAAHTVSIGRTASRQHTVNRWENALACGTGLNTKLPSPLKLRRIGTETSKRRRCSRTKGEPPRPDRG